MKAIVRCLDLFCCEGGAGMGYHRAGFDVTGVDLADHSADYPFDFIQADALTFPLKGFDAIHASPPCQAHTNMSNRYRGQGGKADSHPDLIAPIRARLETSGAPWVIENVPGAAASMRDPFTLTGGMFGLRVHRPRLFESSILILAPSKPSIRRDTVGVFGKHPDGRRLWTRKDGSMQRAFACSLDKTIGKRLQRCGVVTGVGRADELHVLLAIGAFGGDRDVVDGRAGVLAKLFDEVPDFASVIELLGELEPGRDLRIDRAGFLTLLRDLDPDLLGVERIGVRHGHRADYPATFWNPNRAIINGVAGTGR